MSADSKPQAAPERGLGVAFEIVPQGNSEEEMEVQPGSAEADSGPLTCILSFKY